MLDSVLTFLWLAFTLRLLELLSWACERRAVKAPVKREEGGPQTLWQSLLSNVLGAALATGYVWCSLQLWYWLSEWIGLYP